MFIEVEVIVTQAVTAGAPVLVPANAYVAEDGTTPYVAEDGTTYYVDET